MLNSPKVTMSLSMADRLVDEIVGLLDGRTVVVDACVSRDIARKLVGKGVAARHITDMDPQTTDRQIELIMLPSDVLITKDVNFAKSLKGRAILLPLQSTGATRARGRKAPKVSKTRLPKGIRLAAKEQVAREMALGIIQLKILCGLFMVFEVRVIGMDELKEIYRLIRLANASAAIKR
jgi:hypothetical protein